MSITRQTVALIKRNILLKKRSKGAVAVEVFFPVYFVLILMGIKLGVNPSEKPAITTPVCSTGYWPNLQAPKSGGRGILAYAPESFGDIIGNVTTKYMPNVTPEGFSDSAAVDNSYLTNENVVAAVVFAPSTASGTASYSLRFDKDELPSTKSLFAGNDGYCRSVSNMGAASATCPAQKYFTSGFLKLQWAIDRELIRNLTDASVTFDNATACFMPKRPYLPSLQYLQTMVALYMVIAYSPIVSILLSSLVTEKEKKIKEGMKMMGMSDISLWLSWTVTYCVFLLVTTIIVVALGAATKLFSPSNIFLVFLLLYLYALSLMTFSFMLVPFFSKAMTAGGFGSLSTIFFSLFYILVSRVKMPQGVRWFFSIFSPTAVSLGLDEIVLLDAQGPGLTFSNINSAGANFPIYGAYIMLTVDTFLYLLLAFYFDRVVPTEYGQRYSPLFFLKASYWKSQRKRQELVTISMSANNDDELESLLSSSDRLHPMLASTDIEAVAKSLRGREVMQIRDLSKVFPKSKDGKDVQALDAVNLDVYEGEIFALLGHNGAGKSTLIAALTGFLPPTSGEARIFGLNVADAVDLSRLRQMTGVCPQHDILHDKLTVSEHLVLYARMKGVDEAQIEEEVKRAVSDVHLKEKENSLSVNLSGGQKRKLSVAIALIGNPKVVFLDEPTSGMDPYSRRQLWDLLKERRKGRVIFLTTHFMDEADILADRKAILSKGRVRCAGSSVFLKSRFGLGYHLGMVMEDHCEPSRVFELVQRHVQGSQMGKIHGQELTFTLPRNEVAKFPALFREMEGSDGPSTSTLLSQLGISSYGISMTTLEEVFLRLGEEEEVDEEDNKENLRRLENVTEDTAKLTGENKESGANLHRMMSATSVAIDGVPLAKQRFKTLVKARLLLIARDPKTFFFRIIVPVIFVIAGLVLTKQISSTTSNTPSLGLTPSPYFSFSSSCQQKAAKQLLVNNKTGASLNSSFTDSGVPVCVLNNVSASDYLYNNYPHDGLVDVSTWSAARQPSDISAQYTLYGNDTAYHSLPVVLNSITNAMLRLAGSAINISVTSDPLPDREKKLTFSNDVYVSLFILGLSLIVIVPGFAIHAVKDRQCRAKHQLRVSGISSMMYWSTTFVSDYISYLLPVVLILIIVPAVDISSLTTGGAYLSLFLSVVVFMPAMILFGYVLSFPFDKFETCQNVLPTIMIFLGMGPYFAVSIIDMIGHYETARIIHYIASVLDAPYTILGLLYYIDRVYRIALISDSTTAMSEYFKFSSNIPGTLLLVILSWGIFAGLIHFLETRSLRRRRHGVFLPSEHRDGDSDVKDEELRVESGTAQDDPLVVRHLRREFDPNTGPCGSCKRGKERLPVKVAVKDLSVGVHSGEVFGLLGPNGAGKSTTLNMVTGDVAPTAGEVILAGETVTGKAGQRAAMGYCPQFDALWEALTLEEHLRIFTLIKGVEPNHAERLVNNFIDTMDIREHAKKRTKGLSGGTKRKLSFGMSLLGTTHIVLMDEPSTGMDPSSKRFLWTIISDSIRGTRAAMLTTHSMEEVDALCTRVAIMINGAMKCLGSTQHLKSKYGSHYQLEYKLARLDDTSTDASSSVDARIAGVEELLRRVFTGVERVEVFGERANFKVSSESLKKLSVAFESLEKAKSQFGIEEYSLSQATLEQVFIAFAKQQGVEDNSSE